MKQGKNLLEKILFESQAYAEFKDIEKLVELGTDLSVLPIQPLYVSLLGAPSSQVANILPRLSKEQRQAFIDLDFWTKDVVDVESFEYWLETYALSKSDELVGEFVEKDDFLLYLKSRINIHTFDVEDPMYPDHDYYFLTDDSLLLIEYGENFKYPNELKYFIRSLYDSLGVEAAYSKLFKLVNDSFSLLQETSFQEKKERLRDYGFVDYFEAREKLFPFATYPQIKRFIDQKQVATGNIDITAQNQSLHSSSLIGFDRNIENIAFELQKLKDEKRRTYLHFIFIRLINSSIVLGDGLKKGRIELSRIGEQTKAYIELGVQYTKSELSFGGTESLFDKFDFFDMYKVGHSLIHINKEKISKNLTKNEFSEENLYFCGPWWNSFIQNSRQSIPQAKNYGVGLHPLPVSNLRVYEFWKRETKLFCESLPYILSFSKMLSDLVKDHKLNDSFYTNYNLDEIDFEAILISIFMNHCLGKEEMKLGLSVDEFKSFMSSFCRKDGEEYVLLGFDSEELSSLLSSFTKKYSFDSVEGFESYLYGVMTEHLNGYELDSLGIEDFKHIGGPILFSNHA